MTSSPQRTVVSPPFHPHSALPSPPLSPVSPVSPSTSSRAGTTTRIRLNPTRTQSQTRSEPHASNRTSCNSKTRSALPTIRMSSLDIGRGEVVSNVDESLPSSSSAPLSCSESPTTNPAIGPGHATTITRASVDVKAKRRQSSLAYFTPTSPSPRDARPMSVSVSESGDVPASLRGKRESGTWGGAGSKRASMSIVAGTRAGSARESVCEVPLDGLREREPLTLVEKHADLLHFIAQKERKCLELRDQLAVHEKELAELKRKWERIVNRGFASTNDARSHPNPAPNATQLLNSSLGGVALDGLKEGVRMIASGINEVIQDLEPIEQEKKSVPTTISTLPSTINPKLGHAPRESDSSTSVSLSTGTGSISHLSTSSRSSIWDSPSGDALVVGKGEKEMVATAASLSRAGSLNSRMHKRTSTSRTRSKELTTTLPSTFASSLATNVEFGKFVSSPAVLALQPPSKSVGSLTPINGPITLLDSPNSSSWMDSMGKKLEELQKGQVFSKSQKRASVLLAGVSHSIASALLPGPTATTPAPSSVTSPRLSSTVTLPSKGVENWLDEEEEQTKHIGEVMKPVLVSSTTTKPKTATACKPTAVSSFDDDEWNW